ncbi:MAG: DUF4476 domain-containing protein [Bacteroidetes bacterium]|nr:DUF4476 domain-containing protein [Bacteroidota bacterium]
MIKKSILLSLSLFIFTFAFSQKSNLVFFTEQGEPFYVVLNGIKQNADARTNLKISDLTDLSYKCKIIFKNTELGQLDKTIYLRHGFEFTYVIKQNNKNKWLIRGMNETPISNTTISKNDNDYQFSTSEPQTENISTPTSTRVINNKDISNSENLNVSISDPVSNEKIRMDLSTNRASLQNTSNTTIKQTEVRNKPDYNSHYSNNQHQVTNAVQGYNGPYGCNHPMTSQMFADVKTSISSKSFENSKLTIAKQVISNNCLTSAQVKEILKLFDFEATRLDVAKFAYGYTYDKGNYYQLNDAFNFESSIDDLNNYIKTKK